MRSLVHQYETKCPVTVTPPVSAMMTAAASRPG
jgi:hypothetical protein